MADAVTPPASEGTQGANNAQLNAEVQANATDPTGKGYNEDTQIKTMKDLKEVAPHLYKQMMKSLMFNMVNQMNRFRRNLKRAMRSG